MVVVNDEVAVGPLGGWVYVGRGTEGPSPTDWQEGRGGPAFQRGAGQSTAHLRVRLNHGASDITQSRRPSPIRCVPSQLAHRRRPSSSRPRPLARPPLSFSFYLPLFPSRRHRSPSWLPKRSLPLFNTPIFSLFFSRENKSATAWREVRASPFRAWRPDDAVSLSFSSSLFLPAFRAFAIIARSILSGDLPPFSPLLRLYIRGFSFDFWSSFISRIRDSWIPLLRFSWEARDPRYREISGRMEGKETRCGERERKRGWGW